LPFDKKVRDIYVVGPNAANLNCLMGSYYGMSATMTTVLEGIVQQVPEGVKVEYKPGSLLAHFNNNPFDWSLEAAPIADVTVACMGLSPFLEGEEGDALLSTRQGDREDIALPAPQVEYIKKLVIKGAKVVLVLFGGSPIAIGELEDMVEAIIHVWYPGAEGGKAIADILFGKVSPSGKLPLTFPKSLSQLPAFNDYSMDNRTYRYSKEKPLYPFGYGLSYSQFTYSGLKFDQDDVRFGQAVELTFTVTNTGEVEAEEVAQIYLTDMIASAKTPIQKLIGFQRIHLKPSEARTVTFTITPEMMMLFDDDGMQILEPGVFEIKVGGCSPCERAVELGVPELITGKFIVS